MYFDDYAGKRVIVSGCSSGIGQAVATALVDLGAEVHGVDRNPPTLELTSFEQLDLSDPTTIGAAVDRIGGRVDNLFNCAGATPLIPSAVIVKVNFLGTRLLTETVVERMTAGGAIVNTSSDGGFGWRRKRAALLDFVATDSFESGAAWFDAHEGEVGHGYSFSKEAINVWTMQQSATLIRRGIRINTSSPGAVQTPMLDEIEQAFPPEMIGATHTQIGRRSTPEEQVGPLLFLNSTAASYVNGADLAVDGGHWAAQSVAGELWD